MTKTKRGKPIRDKRTHTINWEDKQEWSKEIAERKESRIKDRKKEKTIREENGENGK